MYGIHMGAHMHSDPLVCNLCGVRCKDSQEFLSHLISGKHNNNNTDQLDRPDTKQLIAT